MNDIVMGKYYPINSLIHTLDARAKLIGALYFTVLLIMAGDHRTYWILALYTAILITLSKIPILTLLKSIKPLIRIIIFTTLIQMLTSGGGQIYFSFSFITISELGMLRSLSVLIRFLLTILMLSVISLTTKPLDLTTGLGNIFTPLKLFKINVDDIALMTSIALRFIPTLQVEFERIVKAQISRGMEFEGLGAFEKMKRTTPIFLPVFIRSFYKSKELADALDARNYRAGDDRTNFRNMTWQIGDTIFLLSLAALTVFVMAF